VSQRNEFAKVRAEMDVALDAIALPPPIPGVTASKGPAERGDGGKLDEPVFDDSPGLE
jgi:hypothetical protein